MLKLGLTREVSYSIHAELTRAALPLGLDQRVKCFLLPGDGLFGPPDPRLTFSRGRIPVLIFMSGLLRRTQDQSATRPWSPYIGKRATRARPGLDRSLQVRRCLYAVMDKNDLVRTGRYGHYSRGSWPIQGPTPLTIARDYSSVSWARIIQDSLQGRRCRLRYPGASRESAVHDALYDLFMTESAVEDYGWELPREFIHLPILDIVNDLEVLYLWGRLNRSLTGVW